MLRLRQGSEGPEPRHRKKVGFPPLEQFEGARVEFADFRERIFQARAFGIDDDGHSLFLHGFPDLHEEADGLLGVPSVQKVAIDGLEAFADERHVRRLFLGDESDGILGKGEQKDDVADREVVADPLGASLQAFEGRGDILVELKTQFLRQGVGELMHFPVSQGKRIPLRVAAIADHPSEIGR